MEGNNVADIFHMGWLTYKAKHPLSNVQCKAGNDIFRCKTPDMGCNMSVCEECGYTEIHNNSCRNRHCPNCQAVDKVIWIDARQSEVVDSPYYHAVFTVPDELNSLIYENQRELYGLMHKCAAETILELAMDKKFIGGIPGIIQVLHTWGTELNHHPHIHSVISGACLSPDKTKILLRGDRFFLPVHVVSKKYRGKFLSHLKKYRMSDKLRFSGNCEKLRNSYEWKDFIDALYKKDWVFYIKETFNNFGNAVKYLGNYTHRVAISNQRIKTVDENGVVFSAKDYKNGGYKDIHLSLDEFLERMMWHVLPHRFQKIRYYGFLNNRHKSENLTIIFRLQNRIRTSAHYKGMSTSEIIKEVWNIDLIKCPCCGKSTFRFAGRLHPLRE